MEAKPQKSSLSISKTTIYRFSYSGAAVVVNIVFFYIIFAKSHSMQWIQVLGYFLLNVHYLKRTLESFFVHRPSSVSLPAFTLIFGAAYYWVFGAAIVGYSIFSPKYSKPDYFHPAVPFVLTCAVLFFEYMNYCCHAVLRDLRPPGTTKKGIPRGYGFDLVSGANYFWELCSWISFACLFRTVAAILFCIAGFFAMLPSALSSHKNYETYFSGKNLRYPPGRKTMIPFII
eukprot:TRINITY_DN4320_c0_g5_i1.p1 TRINITY_DN4320_c0_g5~~TRINITY_DN4320_c0_g5_i1.p1  ORF type:complete len:230 (-),score=38.32 TRINITY_DN4320_c0_g5_i1:145-834(-)